jgi:hypothetical protein
MKKKTTTPKTVKATKPKATAKAKAPTATMVMERTEVAQQEEPAPAPTPVVTGPHIPAGDLPANFTKPDITGKLLDLIEAQVEEVAHLKVDKTIYREALIKCHLAQKKWSFLDSFLLANSQEDLTKIRQPGEHFIVGAPRFHTQSVEGRSYGCGIETTSDHEGFATIGYIRGHLVQGSIPAHAKLQQIKYDRKLEGFYVDGRKVIGAEAIVLTKDCQALVLNPVFEKAAAIKKQK